MLLGAAGSMDLYPVLSLLLLCVGMLSISPITSIWLLSVGFAAAQPSNGDIRLVNATGNRSPTSEGTLEIYLSANGTWGTVCVREVTTNFANTVCRQMGYTEAVQLSSNDTRLVLVRERYYYVNVDLL